MGRVSDLTVGVGQILAIRVFTSSTTYVPTPGTSRALAETVGSGAGGGGVADSTGVGQGGGGGGGGYSRALLTAAQIGASQAITVGAPGTGGAAGNNNGTNGGDVSVGTLCVAKGGSLGTGAAANTGGPGGAGGVAGTGDFTVPGQAGAHGANATITTVVPDGAAGGNAALGFGAGGTFSYDSGAALAGSLYGGGGAGASSRNAGGAKAGADGAKGIVIITEYASRNDVLVPTVMPGSLFGLTLSNNSTTGIDIAVGVAASDVAPYVLMENAIAGLTKLPGSAWAVGDGNGGLDTGAVAAGTYHLFLIRRSDTGVVDALFSLSTTAPTMPTGYDQKRRIGSVIVLSTGPVVLQAFTQVGDFFRFKTPTLDVSSTTLGAASASFTLASIPTGFNFLVLLNLAASHATSTPFVYVRCPDDTDTAPSNTAAPLATLRESVTVVTVQVQATVMTNTSAQIAARSDQSSTTFRGVPLGYWDQRGSVA